MVLALEPRSGRPGRQGFRTGTRPAGNGQRLYAVSGQRDTNLMGDTPVPSLEPDELAQRLDSGEPIQVLDIRAPDKIARGHVTLGAALGFTAMPNSRLFALPSLDPLGLDVRRPVAVGCGHGNSSQRTTALLREHGFEAYSVAGGMAQWEAVYVRRRLARTASVEHVVQFDRVGKGCLSYLLVSDGDAIVVDPGRHVER